MKNYIKIVEAASKGCPIATHDIDVNLFLEFFDTTIHHAVFNAPITSSSVIND